MEHLSRNELISSLEQNDNFIEKNGQCMRAAELEAQLS